MESNSEDETLSNYPLGREKEQSAKLLFQYFCDNLSSGRWEVAASCIKQLSLSAEYRKKTQDVLRGVIENPYGKSQGGANLLSPHHLSWMCLIEYKNLLTSSTESDDVQSLTKDVEFRLLLTEFSQGTSSTIIKEIYQYHRHILGLKSASSSPSLRDSHKYLSPSALTFLKSSLETEPAIGHAVITAIKVKGQATYRVQNEALEKLYIDSVLHCLERLSDLQSESERDNIKEKLYTILALYDPEPSLNQKHLTALLGLLVKSCIKNGEGLDRFRLLSCMLGRTDNYLINQFLIIDNELQKQWMNTQNDSTLLPLEDCQQMQVDLLSVCMYEDRDKAWRQFLVTILQHRQHFLDQIVRTALGFVQTQQFDELEQLFSPEELWPIKPLVVLIGWHHCYSSTNARRLLSILWTDQVESKSGVLDRCCNKLAYQLDLIEWCLEKTRLREQNRTSSSGQKATDLFRTLESHSVLYVLHHAAKLSSLDETEVLRLLEKTPNHTETMNDNLSKRTVRFADENTENGDQEGGQPISLEQERDISIYRSYCALKNVMYAIKTCLDYAHLDLMNPTQKRVKRKLSSTSMSSTVKGSCQSDLGDPILTSCSDFDLQDGAQFQEFYNVNVWSKLGAVKENLSEVFPLTFRLEMLENIFSLLFITHKDIQESLQSDSESDDAGVDDAKSSPGVNHHNSGSIMSDDDLSKTKSDSLQKVGSVVSGVMTSSTESQPSALDFDEPFESIYAKEMKTKNAEEQAKTPVVPIGKPKLKPLKLRDDLQFVRPRSPVVDSSQQISGTSTLSTGSVQSLFRLGFMTNEYVVRDLLQILRDCLLELNTAKFRLAGKDRDSSSTDKKSLPLKVDAETEQHLTKIVPCAVTPEKLQKRTSRLTQFVSEAQWRYQLVAHPDIPKQPGHVLTETVQPETNSSDDDYEDRSQETEKRRVKRISRSGHNCSEETGGGETTGSQYTDGGYDSSRQRRPRSSSRRKSVGTSKVSKLTTGIIPSMLSSPKSLLNLCLKRNQPAQANQVVKMFNMDGSPEIAEVAFSALYSEAVKKLHSFGSKSGREMGRASGRSGRISMKMLANVAAAAMATASVSSITDDLLTSSSLPVLPSPQTTETVPVQLTELFHAGLVPCLVVGDLTFTACRTWDLCSSLLEITNSLEVKVTVTGNPDMKPAADKKGMREFKPTGPILLLGQLRELVQFALNCQSPESTTADQILMRKVIGCNPESCLRLSTHPINTSGCRSLLSAIEVLKKMVEKAQSVLVVKSASPKPSRERTPSESSLGILHGSPQSFSKQEQPVIHNAMKLLIHALEKHIPAGGFILHFIRNFRDNIPTTRNYLLSLYDHVKELAFLVAECEAKTKDAIIVPTNYFKMLEEGPIATLGRLMFVKKMQPARLEKVAQKLSLNLTHIIVRSCCPRVPSKHMKELLPHQMSDIHYTPDGRVVLNERNQGSISPRHPEIVARCLLSKLIQFMRDIAQKNNARGIFTSACAEITVQTTEYDEITIATQELKYVQLDLLKSREEKICFFGNLQNLLTLHSFLFHTLKHLNDQDYRDDHGVLDSVVQTNAVAYHVGQLGIVSLFDVKYVINRCGLHPPAVWNKLLKSRLYALDPVDPWFRYVPPPEPRLLFVTMDTSVSSPPIQILSPDMVQTQLHQAMKDYLNMTVSIDLDRKQVTIPELLVWYRRDFSSEKLDQFDAPNEGLVNFISTQVTGSTESDLIQLLQLDQVHDFGENIDSTGRKELPFLVKVQGFNHDRQINFDWEMFKRGSHPLVKTHRRSTSLPPSMESSEDLSLGKDKESSTYQMTPITLEYVKEDSPLCATLVSLICSDQLDDIEEHIEDDYFAENTHKMRKRTMSDISLVDIRSYRYHRLTDDYPILKRQLLNLVVPLAAAEEPDIIKSGDPILKFVTSSISDKVKGCMLNLHGNREYQTCLAAILNQLFTSRDWKAVLSILTCIPKMQLDESPHLKILSDFVVCCLATTLTKPNSVCSAVDADVVCHSIRLCLNINNQSRTALALVKFLPLDAAMTLLQFCLSNQDLCPQLTKALRTKMTELKIYEQISLCAREQIQAVEDLVESVLPVLGQKVEDVEKLTQYLDWRNVQKMRAGDVLNLLIRSEDFDTARAWAELHNISDSKYQEIEQKFIQSLLSKSPPNTTRAFKSLESILETNDDTCYTMCKQLLDVVKETANVLFLTNFVLSHLSCKLSDHIADNYRCLNMGAKSLLSLPESIRGEYEHLITAPKLLLEQLLMNMKADLAGQIFRLIKLDFCKVMDSSLSLSMEEFDELLAKYGTKAIEFPVVQVTGQEGDQSPSRSSPHTADADPSSLPKASFMESMRFGSSRRSVDYSANRSLLSSSLGASPNRRSFSPPSSKSPLAKFSIPADPPPKEKWVPDSAVSVCMVCQIERFSMFNRRHHCRRCGRVVCASCSTKTSVIMGVSARTCDECYEQMFKPRLDVLKEAARRRESLSASVSPVNRVPPVSSADSSVMGGPELSAPEWNISSVIRHTEHEWKLKTDGAFNMYTRDEFYYEQAPSASLCISILSMMSSQSKAGQLMLQLCDELSKTLRPIAPGVPNPEVDYSLVISIMKHLLFRAKMIYIQSGEAQGLGMCDTYLSRVDLLNLLVSSNVSDIPSIQELTKVESVSRLRDRLIEDERLPLAMDVSTKCGLDTSGVWAAWGMACLQCADYAGAREKFNRCLKAPLDRNKTQQTSKFLLDIIDCLETMPSTGNTDVRSILSSPGSIKSLVSMPPLRYVDESSLDKAQFDEAIYYLKTFGSYLTIVQFYRRHGYLMKATQYILDHKCSTEVFVEGLLMPSLIQEDLGKLEDQLTMIDPTLEKWGPYLTATCRHLMKSKLMHVLYHVQIFMKDYIRAAMNCITYFYQRGARTYLDLAGRVKHLFEAQKHLDAYLDPSKWGSVRPPNYSSVSPKPSWSDSHSLESSSARLTQTPQEVKKYLKSVIIQIEVTKYMEKSLTIKPPDGTAIAIIQSYLTGKEPPPTVFGNSKVRADVVTMVLMVGEDLLTSFDLSMKIIKEYRLSAVPILKHTAHEMAKFHDYPRIHELLNCLKHAGMDDPQSVDEIIGACIIILKDDPAEAKEVDGLIKLLRLDSNKINAMILVGKLKSAYLLAVKSERVEDVQRISGAAQRSGQNSVRNICDKWLSQRLKTP